MKTYTFYYCLDSSCLGVSHTEQFTVAASIYAIAFSRFVSFCEELDSNFVSFSRFYRVDSPDGKNSLRSLKNSSLTRLDKITIAHNNKDLC